jgi:hypothetical protein
MTDPNSMQVAGDHYRSNMQHWDWVIQTAQGYLEGNVTRYIARWRKKNGVEDLKKALHYANKLESIHSGPDAANIRPGKYGLTWAYTDAFAKANNLTYLERQVCADIAGWESINHIRDAIKGIGELIDLAEGTEPLELRAVPVPLSEENHYSPRVGDPEDHED